MSGIAQRTVKTPFSLTVGLFLITFAYALSTTMIGPLVPIFIQQYNLFQFNAVENRPP